MREELILIVDDLDGSPAITTIRFELEGRRYEIDLSAENVSRLRSELAPYIAAARRLKTPRKRS